MKPYLIKWIDIIEDGGWHSPEEFNDFVKNKKENIVTQVGFIYSQDKLMTVLVDSWIGSEEIQYGVITKIPTDCICMQEELHICIK